MTCNLTNPIFTDEAKALAHMEESRWPEGVTCPLCGADNVRKMGGNHHREFINLCAIGMQSACAIYMAVNGFKNFMRMADSLRAHFAPTLYQRHKAFI